MYLAVAQFQVLLVIVSSIIVLIIAPIFQPISLDIFKRRSYITRICMICEFSLPYQVSFFK